MELYAKPIIETADDGTINIRILPITPEYIDARLAELAVFDQIDYNIEGVVNSVQFTSSTKQAKRRLMNIFSIGPAEADFLLQLTTEEIAYYFNRSNCNWEIAKWERLKNILENDEI